MESTLISKFINNKEQTLKQSLIDIFKLAIPIFIIKFIEAANDTISLHYISLLGNSVYLAAVGLAMTFCSMFIIAILIGVNNAY